MIKKLSLFFSAIAIGILSIFGSISTKNTAEPQYFIENTQVKNQYVNNPDCNILELDYIYTGGDNALGFSFSEYQTIYFINDNLPSNTYIAKYENVSYLGFNETDLEVEINEEEYVYIIPKTENDNTYYQISNLKVDKILFNEVFDIDDAISGNVYTEQERDYAFNNLGITNDLDTNLVLPTIEYTSEPIEPEEPQQTTLEQISTIISDIINWFKNIFSGSSEIFYANNELTAWGTVLFIGVAIMLISICLKWVISLVRGV